MADTCDVERPCSPVEEIQPSQGQLVPVGHQLVATLSPRFFDSRPIRVILGGSGRSFWAHSWHLAYTSEKMSKSLALGAKNRDELLINIPGDDVDTMQRFLCWLYNREDIPLSSTVHEKYVEIIRLFILAEKYGVRGLQEDLAGIFFSMIKAKLELPSWEAIDLAFEHLPGDSAGRWMVAHAFVWHETRSLLTEPLSKKEMRKRPKFSTTLNWRLSERCFHEGGRNPFTANPKWYVQGIRRVTGSSPAAKDE